MRFLWELSVFKSILRVKHEVLPVFYFVLRSFRCIRWKLEKLGWLKILIELYFSAARKICFDENSNGKIFWIILMNFFIYFWKFKQSSVRSLLQSALRLSSMMISFGIQTTWCRVIGHSIHAWMISCLWLKLRKVLIVASQCLNKEVGKFILKSFQQ